MSGQDLPFESGNHAPLEAEDLVDILSEVLNYLRRGLSGKYSGRLDPSLTSPQIFCLKAVGRQPGTTMGDLARDLQTGPTAITGLVDRLEERGLVERVADPRDRRVIRVRLTPKGKETMEEFRRVRVHLVRELLNAMPPDSREALWRGLRGLRDSARKLSGREQV